MLPFSRRINGPMGPVTIMPSPRGSLGNLKAVPVEIKFLEPNAILLNVIAVGLNFRDVLNVLGMYPGDPGPPGGDCAGIVVQVGRDVSKLRIGQAVFGQAIGSLGSVVAINEHTVVPMPACISYEIAASIPTVYLTALACLDAATQVGSRQKVLIHAATGGLGIAATQIATKLGAQVIGTAGGVAKRNALRSMTSTEIALGSRSTRFATDCLEVCSGVDVVLNSLTSPGMIAASLATLLPGGSFIEVAKRDIWSSERISQERPDVRFSTVAVDFMPPSVVHNGLLRISALMGSGDIFSSPLLNFNLGNGAQALRQLSSARHIGKIITTQAYTSRPANSVGSWAIIGGTGALGLLAVRHLATFDIHHFLIYGRSGRATLVEEIKSAQVSIRLIMSDVAASGDLKCESDEDLICGVLHAGGVVNDATIFRQSPITLRGTMAPKVCAMQNILKRTHTLPLHTLNVFSSIASVLGSGGQSNYSIANSLVDAAAVASRKSGTPSTTVNWGAWAGAGMAVAAGLERMERLGFGAIEPPKGLAALIYILSEQTLPDAYGQIIASVFYWDRFELEGNLFNNMKMKAVHKIEPLERSSSFGPTINRDSSMSVNAIFEQIKLSVRHIIGSEVAASSPLVDAGLDSLGKITFFFSTQTRCCSCAIFPSALLENF